jgi:hypothetical protein
MRPILRKIRERAARAADRTSASGSAAGQDGTQPQRPSARDRGEMRRRIRQLRRRRDALLLELGGLVMEMHRQGRGDQQLVSSRADEVSRVDAEARELARAVDAGERLDDLVAAGILGPCGACGTLLSTDARYCSQCGTAVAKKPAGAAQGSGSNGASNGSGRPAAAPASDAGESAGVAAER